MISKYSALVFAPHFIPGYKAGGVLRSLVNFIDLFADIVKFSVLTSDRDLNNTEAYYDSDPYVKATEKYTAFYCGRFYVYVNELLKLSKKNYDFVFLNGFFNLRYVIIPLLVRRLLFRNSKFYVYARGELFDSALKNKFQIKKTLLTLFRIIGLFNEVVVIVTDETELATVNKFLGKEVTTLIFPDLPSFSFAKKLVDREVSIQEKPNDALSLIFIGRIAEIKNLHFFISSLSEVQEKIHLSVYGGTDCHKYYETCLLEANMLPENIKVTFEGECKYDELPQAISSSDMLVLPSLSENFGHVVAESLLLGVPVYVTKNSPWQGFLKNDYGIIMDIDSDISGDIKMLREFIELHLVPSHTLAARIEFSNGAREKMISFFEFDQIKQKLFNI